MSISKASASWRGSLKNGSGVMKPASAAEIPFSLPTRLRESAGSNPEELVGAALAGCYSMALTAALGREGHEPESVETRAEVTLDKDDVGLVIKSIELHTSVRLKGIEPPVFEHIARSTKESCPVGKALLGVSITLHAALAS